MHKSWIQAPEVMTVYGDEAFTCSPFTIPVLSNVKNITKGDVIAIQGEKSVNTALPAMFKAAAVKKTAAATANAASKQS